MINSTLSRMVQSALDGESSFCEVFRDLKDIAKHIEVCIDQVKDGARAEALEFEKDEQYHGMEWTIGTSRTFLNFKEDKEWKDLNDLVKDREKILTNAWKAKQDQKNFFDEDFEYIDEEAGEVVPVVTVKTPAKEWVSCKAPKPKAQENTGEGKKMIFD